jgi:hypothetical protein
MVFATIASLVLFLGVGGLLVVAAFHSEALAGWENRTLLSMADAVRQLRITLEAKEASAQAAPATPQCDAPAAVEIAVMAAPPKKSKPWQAA